MKNGQVRNGTTLVAALLVMALAFLGGSTASAHHSAAMFDQTKSVKLEGTVKQFQWTNPHTWLTVTVQDEGGLVVDWSVEMTSPNLLARAGWRPNTVKPGDKITVNISPLRDGSSGGQFVSATLADGRVLKYEGITPAPGTSY
ncbi:MAG: hypothetical protein JNK21_00165 [Rhodospirillaceae bacterium]|nr:hypothetical protein [Rhodospirillaceae bacterium]